MRWLVKDNSGIKIATLLKIKKTKCLSAKPGDLLTIFPQKFKLIKNIQRRSYLGLVVLIKGRVKRRGYDIYGQSNCLLVLNKDEKFLGSRIFGSVFKEVEARRLRSFKYKRIYARIGGRFI